MDSLYSILPGYFLSLMVFFLYHRMLKINFQVVLGLKDEKTNPIVILISVFRTLIIASFLYLIIVKLKQNIWGILLGLISYQLVLLLSALLKSRNHKN